MQLEEAEKLAVSLMQKHGLHNWSFKFDRAKWRFGCCNYTKKQISLSHYLTELNPEKLVKDTILHEIAHALTPGDGHGPLWRQKCIEIGANPQRCYDHTEVESPTINSKPNYIAVCTSCQQAYYRKQLRYKTKNHAACSVCCQRYNGGQYSERFKLSWEKYV